MAEVLVNAEFDVPADRLWGMLRDFRDLRWVPGADALAIEFEGDGPGMVRLIPVAQDRVIREELYARDDAQRRIEYGITQNNPLPCDDYRAAMVVGEDGPKRCRLRWSCTFEPRGVSEADAVAAVKGFYAMMIESIRKTVA